MQRVQTSPRRLLFPLPSCPSSQSPVRPHAFDRRPFPPKSTDLRPCISSFALTHVQSLSSSFLPPLPSPRSSTHPKQKLRVSKSTPSVHTFSSFCDPPTLLFRSLSLSLSPSFCLC
ncbi:hypothetical protein CKAH01_02748 [Colletotrichum kahawae]|uniref:Uncharacterized protein n=1 Tax=Colletotrichum kahawae TaxID=34407 RepID=A0AAD9XY63_COLKA|nr:hypothetical protein CKAH01_02748 [Colletotrichum kahawae]